jgi:hypothetical protein
MEESSTTWDVTIEKIATPELRSRYFDPMRPMFEPPTMAEDMRIPHYLGRLGLSSKDIDVVFLGHNRVAAVGEQHKCANRTLAELAILVDCLEIVVDGARDSEDPGAHARGTVSSPA